MKESNKKMWLSYLYGILLFMGMFMGLGILISIPINLINGVSLGETFTNQLNVFFPVLVSSALVWLPLGLITGHKWYIHGPKRALRFAIIADLSIIAVVLVLIGACYGIASTF